jgi:hypothetical protein
MHGSAAHCNRMLSLRRPNSGIGPDSAEHSENTTRVEVANVMFVFRTLGIGMTTLPRGQQLGFHASFMHAMFVRIVVVFQ